MNSLTGIIIFLASGILLSVVVALFFAGRITKPLLKLKAGAEEIAKGNLQIQVKVKTKDEIGVLANTFNKMASDLDKYTKELVVKERLAHELELAAEIQQEMLPDEIPEMKGIDIAASVIPATEVGGDCYDFLPVDENNTLIYIGDVTGHGVPAGLVVAITNSLIYTFSEEKANTREIIVAANRVLQKKTRKNVFVTAIMSNWDAANNRFTFTSAGHDQIIHFKATEGKAILAPKGGMALGMLPDISDIVKEEEIALQKGDTLLLYTDGIPEAWKSKEVSLGMDNFLKIAEKHGPLASAQEIHDAILKEVKDFMGEYPQADDIGLVVIKKV